MLDQSKPENHKSNSNLCASMSDVNMLFLSPTHYTFVDYKVPLSLKLLSALIVTILASPTPWSHHQNLGFTFRILCNDIFLHAEEDPKTTCHSYLQNENHVTEATFFSLSELGYFYYCILILFQLLMFHLLHKLFLFLFTNWKLRFMKSCFYSILKSDFSLNFLSL